MEESGFEPPNSERAVLQTAAFSHFAIPPLKYSIILAKIYKSCKSFWQVFLFFTGKSLDFVPFTFPNEDFAELADYVDKNYKPVFAKKITFIAFAIIYNYDSRIFLDPDLATAYPDLDTLAYH